MDIRPSQIPTTIINHPPKYTKKDEDDIINFIKKTKYKIIIIEDFMTIKLAKMLSRIQTTFISNIRLNIYNLPTPTDFDIYWNTSMMYNWITLMKPEMSMLKYRPIYFTDTIPPKYMDDFKISRKNGFDFLSDIKKKKFHMSKGTFYIQAWAGKSSSEMRLWIKKKDINNIVEYDNDDIDNKCFYFNNINRGYCIHENKHACISEHFCYCNDCALEAKIWDDYLKTTKKKKPVIYFVKRLGCITSRPLTKQHINILSRPLTNIDYAAFHCVESNNKQVQLEINMRNTRKHQRGSQGLQTNI